jgi:hypothetical protein
LPRWSINLGALVSALTIAPPARAEPPGEDGGTSVTAGGETYWVDFHAGEVEISSNVQDLVLNRNVVVTVDRYRLTSDRLSLKQSPSGLLIEGPGRFAFCPCPEPPVSLGFKRVLAAPPTDLLVSQPTLRIGDVPVMWLPYLWLRSPERIGVLPPDFEYRSEEGLVLGSGLHVPLSKRAVRALDVRGYGYLDGGARAEVAFTGERGSSLVRWDRFKDSQLLVDARGDHRVGDAALVVHSIDLLRGARGRRGMVELEPAARRSDRARLGLLQSGAPSVFGLTASLDAPRGGSIDDTGLVGPSAFYARGGALGRQVAESFSVSAATRRDAQSGRGDWSVVTQRGELFGRVRPGPFGVSLLLREALAFETDEFADVGRAQLGGRSEVHLPLARTYGRGPSPLVHRVEPFLGGGADYVFADVPREDTERARVLGARVGLRTALGRPLSLSALRGSVSAGYVAQKLSQDDGAGARGLDDSGVSDDGAPVVASDVSLSSKWASGRAEGAWFPRDTERVTASARARVGTDRGPSWETYVDARTPRTAHMARFLTDAVHAAPVFDWLDRAGTTLGSGVSVPFGPRFATAWTADADALAVELLAVRGSAAYRHRCGCLAVIASGGHRLGRDGVDAWLTVDLAP